MKKKTKIISAALVGIAVIYCGVKIGIPIYQRNKFETVRKNVEALIPEKADMLFSEIEGVKNVKTTTDFRFEVNSGSKFDCYDCADNIKYEIYVDDNLDKLDEESQYEYLEKINKVAQSVYNDIINNDYPDYSDFKSDASKMKFYDKWVNFYGNREVYVLTDNNEYECYQYATDSFAKNGKEIDLEKIRKEKEFKNGYKEEEITFSGVSERENIGFDKKHVCDYEEPEDSLQEIDVVQEFQGVYAGSSYKQGDRYFAVDGLKSYLYDSDGNIIVSYDLVVNTYDNQYCMVEKLYKDGYNDNIVYAFMYNEDGQPQRYKVKVNSDNEIESVIEALQSKTDNKQFEEEFNRIPPAIGMTAEAVRNSTWGEPKDINKTTFAWGTSEQWVYPNCKYIYLDNGIVTAIQE